MDCHNCVYNYYESDTNYSECTNRGFQEDWDNGTCPGYYSHEDAQADAELEKGGM